MFTVTIVIPVRPGMTPTALERIARLEWPSVQLELLVAEGANPSRQRNQAVQQARGEVIYFLDDDSLVAPDCLRRLQQHFSDPRVVAVGGPSLTPASDSRFQRAVGFLLGLPLASGGVRARYRAFGKLRHTSERELILCNLAIRRERFLTCGGLDERLYPNEENELLDRLQQEGGRFMHDPELTVQRSQRPTVRAFVWQMFRYGRGRARQTRLAGPSGLMPFAPLGLLLYLFVLPFLAQSFWYLPLCVYSAGALCSGVWAVWQQRQAYLLLAVPVLLPLMHIANGAGLLAGFLLPLAQQPCYKDVDITVRSLSPAQPVSGER